MTEHEPELLTHKEYVEQNPDVKLVSTKEYIEANPGANPIESREKATFMAYGGKARMDEARHLEEVARKLGESFDSAKALHDLSERSLLGIVSYSSGKSDVLREWSKENQEAAGDNYDMMQGILNKK